MEVRLWHEFVRYVSFGELRVLTRGQSDMKLRLTMNNENEIKRE